MKNRFKKLTALLLAASMTVSMSGIAYASEVVSDVQEETEVVAAEAVSEDTEAVDGVTAVAKVASELKAEAAELKTLEAGVDYAEEEGFFLAESKEDAEKVAKEYGAKLQSYEHGVAVLDFDRNVADALTETAEAKVTTTVVEPNYYDSIDTVNEEDLATAIDDAKAGVTTAASKGDFVTGDEKASKVDEASEPNDPWAKEEHSYYQWFHEKIHSLAAHEVTTGKNVTVAVLDTGIEVNAPDFKSKIADGSIVVDCVSSLKSTTKGADIHGHGSNCSGVVGAVKDNNAHGFGVAPDVNIYSVQISSGSRIATSDEIEGLNMAIEKGVQVVSMSFGGSQYSAAMQEACNQAAEKGITLVAAAGNDTSDDAQYPAAYDNVISVASIDKDDTLSEFSNYGSWVDIAAPGGAYIFSEGPYNSKVKDYITGMGGTSQATPQVAAVAALIYSVNPTFVNTKTLDTPRAVEALLMETTNNQVYTYNGHSVTGLVQADAAVNAAKNYTGSISYRVVDPSGDYGVYMSGKIGKGGVFKLSVGTASGNNSGSKAKIKATWTSSDPATLSVKNGVVRCSKNAIVGTKAYVTATIGTETVSYAFTVTEKTQVFGPIRYRVSRKGYKFLYKSNYSVNASRNTYYDISDPYSLTGGKVFLTYDKKKNEMPGYYVASGGFKYKISMSKSQLKNCVVSSANRNGDPRIIGFTKPGKYTIKYKVMDGSNKTFTLKLTVR